MGGVFTWFLGGATTALSFLGLAAMSMAAYLYDSLFFLTVIGLWCVFGLFFNRWMLAPALTAGHELWSLWLWSLLGCWAWPLGYAYGMALRRYPPA